MRIPDHIIEEIRTHANILDVVGEHVRLRKAGRNYVGLCPFHKEKTPSFNVNAEKGMYKCFGCGRAGNSITFVEEYLHLSFPDAIKHLAAKLGIVIPEESDDDPTGLNARRDGARRALMDATEFFQNNLQTSDGAPARAFFERRAFTPKTIELFSLGASVAAWDSLLNYLQSRGFTKEHLDDAGLIVQREDGSMYDRFRGRAMFTIRDDSGRVVGFSARTITDDPNTPKYINSPQSIVFDKGRVLYGLDQAKRSILEHRTAFIVEGQVDVITMHQAGFLQAVASSGTALTEDHLRLLKKWADSIVLIFDADSAGRKAMTRGIELGLAAGFDVKCVTLEPGHDPDSFIRKNGTEKFKELLSAALPWLTYQTQRFQEDGALSDSVKQASAVKQMLTWIASVPDELRKPFLVRDLAEQFKLDERFLLQQLGSSKQQRPYQAPLQQTKTQEPEKLTVDVGLLPSERELIKMALTEQAGLAMMMHQYDVDVDQFVSVSGKRIFERITFAEHEHHDVAHSIINDQFLTIEERTVVADLVASSVKPSEGWRKFEVEIPEIDVRRTIGDSILHLELFRTTQEIQALSKRMSHIVDLEEYQRHAVQIQRLTEQRNELHKKLELRAYSRDESTEA